MCAPCTQHDIYFISLRYMHAYAHVINDIEALIQSTRVRTRHVQENLHE